jgi:hypothetical protein
MNISWNRCRKPGKWIVPVIPAPWKVEIGRIEVAGHSEQKLLTLPISDNRPDMVVHVGDPS